MATPRGWITCGLCLYPVRRACFPTHPPERDHAGVSKDAAVHRQALPTVFDVEFVPGLKEIMPWYKEPEKRAMKKRGTAALKKRPAASSKQAAQAAPKKRKSAVVKRPASKVASARALKKKPAASR